MTYELNNTNASHDLSLPGEVHVAPDSDSLFDELGCWFTAIGLKAVRDRGVFHIALSGGTTPWPFYHRLLIDTRFRKVPWEHTHIWIVDERRVPFEDERSNYRSLRESLLDDIPTPQEQVHPMQVMSDDPAGEYEDQLKLAFDSPTETPRLDFVLLGMGDDCHTASLFPQSDAIHVSDRWVV
ncbi:MAG: 6-phosphogluconolactonase, partial [Candidatus Zixiibacteriota bacterium]